jgi:hypothetical protein
MVTRLEIPGAKGMVTFGETPRRSARAKSHHHAPAFDEQRYQPARNSADGGETPNRESTLALILDRVNSVRPALGPVHDLTRLCIVRPGSGTVR